MRRDFVYFFLGIVLAVVMMPPAVLAATQLVRIQGPSGNVAQVDAARQLLVAESDPANYLYKHVGVDSGDGCVVIDARPSTAGLVIRQVRMFVFGGAGTTKSLIFYANKTCSGNGVFSQAILQNGSHTETFEPGIPIKAGSGFSATTFGSGLVTTASIYGYTVPANAIP